MALHYLITGGAGFLGINLCRYLRAQGQPVRSLDIAPFRAADRCGVEVIEGDVRDRTAVEAALADIDVVVHCAAALPLAPRAEILSTAIDGTELLLDCARAHQVQRFIFISSTAVYGVPDHHPLREGDPLHGVGAYGESKIRAEALCQRALAQGRCISILRPKSFVGPERLGAFELLYDWAYSGHDFPILGAGNNHYQLLDVADLCRAIELCATLEAPRVSGVFNVGAREYRTLREDFQAVLDRAGHGRHVVSIPVGPAMALLEIFEALHLSPLYRWIYATAAQESVVATDKIEQQLGFRANYSNQNALIRNYDWYVAHRRDFRSLTGTTHRVPWKKGVLQLAKCFF